MTLDGNAALYRLFGMTIRSPFAIDAPVLADPAPVDVEIALGDVPATLEGGNRYNPLNEVVPGQVLLTQPECARYLVRDGATIRAAPVPGVDPAALALFTAVTPLAAILHQRGRALLHASGVVIDGGVWLFVAPSGVGKSTLAAALARRGHALVTDDMAAIDGGAGGWTVAPGPARLKLWPDSLDALAVDDAPLSPIRNGVTKKFLPMATASGSDHPLAGVVALELQDRSAIDVERMPRERAVAMLMHNTFRRAMQAAVAGLGANFARLAPIAAEIPCYTIRRWSLGLEIDALADRVEGLAAGR